MPTYYQAPVFNAQFIDDDGTPLAGGFLSTYASGTTTPLATYEDQAGLATNTNPIVLDAAGRCNLWLGTSEYTFELLRSDLTLVKTWDDVAASSVAGLGVTSVNGLTGVVALTADDIPFTTTTATSWFSGADVTAALDAVIARADAVAASGVSVSDAGGLLTATNVESALAELAAGTVAAVPSQTGNNGKFLTTNGLNTSWAVAGAGTSTQAATGTLTMPGGLIMKWGTTATIGADSSGNAITFGTAFPTNCFVVVGSASTAGIVGGGEGYSVALSTWNTAGFVITNDSVATAVSWIAIGN